jgi:hypothetical protein
MGSIVTPAHLETESARYKGTGGISQENRDVGFVPAFLDTETGEIHLSRFADGRQAPLHLLDGLPSSLIHARGANGRAIAAKSTVVAGFVRGKRFYTRAEAAAEVACDRRAAVGD